MLQQPLTQPGQAFVLAGGGTETAQLIQAVQVVPTQAGLKDRLTEPGRLVLAPRGWCVEGRCRWGHRGAGAGRVGPLRPRPLVALRPRPWNLGNGSGSSES
jgi:hypothetical protein